MKTTKTLSQRRSYLPPIGIYVHAQGRGHATRATAIATQLRVPVTIFSSATHFFGQLPPHVELVALSSDLVEEANAYDQSLSPAASSLHYAPLQVPGIQSRMLKMARWMAEARPSLFIVDLSAEVAMLARLMSVPTVVVRLQGWRDDAAHLAAFENARAILCPFPQAMDLCPLPLSLQSKTFYTGAYGRFAERPTTPGRREVPEEDYRILMMLGSGGTALQADQLKALAESLPQAQIRVIGDIPEVAGAVHMRQIECLGHCDPWPHLQWSDVVICGAGSNTVFEVGQAERPMICFPEQRAFDEQVHKAQALARFGLALHPGNWPNSLAWPGLIKAALSLDIDQWKPFFEDPDLAKTARFLRRLARESYPLSLASEAPTSTKRPAIFA